MSIRLTGILILLLALVASLVFYVRSKQPETREDPRPEIWDVDYKVINRIEVRLPPEEKEVAFLLNKDTDTWFFDDDRKTPVDRERWGGIVFLVSSPKGKRTIADQVDNPEKYGLLNPGLIVALGLDNSDQPFEILFGDPTPQKDQYYVKLGHSNPVYLINNTFVEVLKRLAMEPPVHPLVKARDEESEQ